MMSGVPAVTAFARTLSPKSTSAFGFHGPGRFPLLQTLRDLLLPFGVSVHAKATALRELHLTQMQQARLRESISDDIKKCSNFVVPEVSDEARGQALVLGIELHDMCWHDQGKFDANRSTFHFEHVRPVSTLRELCLVAASADATTEILLTNIRVAWILKSEDAKLSALGFRSKRPNPDDAYYAAGIVLHHRDSKE